MLGLFGALLSLFLILIYLLPPNVSAQTDAIPEPRVDCLMDTYRNPEFSSDRPYQASICGDRQITYWCGNKVIVNLGTVSCPYKGSPTCTPRITHFDKKIVVDLTDVELPILGNTDDTRNSQSQADLDDGTKVSQYLSWYLNGVDAKAEYEESSDDQIINFSGPIKRLMPSVMLDAQRLKTIASAAKPEHFIDEDTKLEVAGKANHNHIVVCAKEGDGGFLGWIQDIANIGTTKAVPCYEGGDKKAQGDLYRLLEWSGSLSPFNAITNVLVSGAINYFETIFPFVSGGALEASLGDHYNFKFPPLPWDDGTGVPFATDVEYQKAYYEWRGQTCVILPVIDRLACFENFLVPNKYADLYKYVPLANTTDKRGSHLISLAHISASKAKIENKSYEILRNAALWMPHSLENYQLTEFLKNTFKPGGQEGAGDIPADVENNSTCKLINTRSNPGDAVTFNNPKSQLEVDVHFDVTEIECDEPKEICEIERNPLSDKFGQLVCKMEASCKSDVYVEIPTVAKIPYADEIWENTVAGADSIFRRIYPKTGPEAPVQCIQDIPAESKATYTIGGGTSDKLQNPQTITLYKIVKPDGSVTTGDGASIESNLYYPHYGGVLEYFLTGIQTALRPKGYGEPLSAKSCVSTAACGEWESKLAGSGGACGICNAPIGDLAKKILTAAGTAYNVPAANIWAAMLHEGGDWTEFNGFKDEDVRKWSNSLACGGEPMPRCNNNDPLTQAPFGFLSHWFYLGDGNNALWSAVQNIDPTRNSKDLVSRCNFLDAAFAAAKLLQQSASNTVAGMSCGSYSGFDTTYPGTCSAWTDLKVAQSQNGYAGLCVNDLAGNLYTIEQAVGWYNDAKCN